ncbi:MAG: Mbeg1-like protein [Pseudomonadota bacterium]
MATLLEFAKLSRTVYPSPPGAASRVPPDWEPYGPSSNDEWEKKWAFHAQAYRKTTGEVVISFRGTEFKKLPNLYSDARLSIGLTHRGEECAIAYTMEVLKKLRAEYGDGALPPITVTGHSLGGNLAQVVTAFFENNGESPPWFNPELAQKVKADFQDIASSLRMPAVTFQAPGVAKSYIAEGKDSKYYDGLHLFNPRDLVRLGGSVNIGVPSELSIARGGFKDVVQAALEQASDILSVAFSADRATPTSADAASQGSGSASPWRSYTPSVSSLSKLPASAASAVGEAAQTAITFFPAHKIGATIDILEAQPAIGNLTPQLYKDLMARPEQLDLLRAITPTQYEAMPYHKSILLKALLEDNLNAGEISIVIDGLKALAALEPEQKALRNKGKARLIAWQKQWNTPKADTGVIDSTAFELLAQLRQTMKEHRQELHALGKGLETWLNANQDRINVNQDRIIQEQGKRIPLYTTF